MSEPKAPTVDPLSMFRVSPPDELNKEEPKKEETPPEAKKPEKSKDVQFSELKRQKELAEKEAEKLKKELEEYSALKPLKAVGEYIKTKAGDINEETVNKFIEKGKDRKKKLTEYEQQLQEKEERLKEISIDHSSEFNQEYIAPLQTEQVNLTALIANLDNEGKVKHESLINQFRNALLKIDDKGQPLDSIKVKSLLLQFEKEYKKATGEDYELPNLSQLVNQVSTVVKKTKEAVNAKQNWSKVREEKERERLFNEATRHADLLKKEEAGRNYITNKIIKDFDYSAIEGIIPEDTFKETLQTSNAFLIEVLNGKKKKDYGDLLVDLTKASQFDDLVAKCKTLQEELEKEQKKNKSGLPAGGGSQKPKPQSGEQKKEKVNPLAVFGR